MSSKFQTKGQHFSTRPGERVSMQENRQGIKNGNQEKEIKQTNFRSY